MVLGYAELPEAEVPDENIWHHAERLEEWWEAVKARRENPELQPVEDDNTPGDWQQNELTAHLHPKG